MSAGISKYTGTRLGFVLGAWAEAEEGFEVEGYVRSEGEDNVEGADEAVSKMEISSSREGWTLLDY